MATTPLHLGLDLGSISLKAALVGAGNRILFHRWVRVAGAPRAALARLLEEIRGTFPEATIAAVGATGSGRALVAEAIAAREVNEITAQAAAAAALHPEVAAIIEIGGQDSKLIVLGDGGRAPRSIAHFAMNELCAAGTGAFLDQQAARLGLPIEAFAALALDATDPAPIAGRCAVFAKSDMTHHQQEGRLLPDIVAGLNEALVRSYCSNMVRGRELPRPISFQGGVAANAGLARAFKKILGLSDDELVIPEYYNVMGAIGAALIAAIPSPASKTSKALSLRLAAAPQRGGPRCGTSSSDTPFCRKVAGAGSSPAPRSPRIEATESGELRRRERASAVFDASGIATAKLQNSNTKPVVPDFSTLALDGVYLGIDVGSVSVKYAAIGPGGIVASDYRFSDGKPLETLRAMLADARLDGGRIAGAAVTGSGRQFIGRLLGADVILNEITAQAQAAAFLLPGADTVVEIGGQDAKFMRLDGGRAAHFAMNRVCAAGTGAFLQEQAERLAIDLDGAFAREAFASERPAALGNRCTVFMESDLVAHQQAGASRRDLCAGLATSVVANYLEKVAAGHPAGARVLFLGGVAENAAVVAALAAALGKPVATSAFGRISGAIGAALAAFEARRAERYRTSSLALGAAALSVDQFSCESCANRCRITRAPAADARDGARHFGGRCGKWDSAAGAPVQRRDSPLKRRTAMLAEGIARPEPGAGRRRVGIPRALFAWDKLPEWRTFFEALGCDVVLSPPTDDAMLAEGARRLVVETCLPAKALSAHVAWLEMHGDVDFLFVPSIVNTSEDRYGKETTHCPYVIGAVQFAQAFATTPILNPVINWRWDPRDEEREMTALAARLGRTPREAARAWRLATSAGADFRGNLRRMGDGLLAKLRDGTLGRAFVLLGKDYTIGDARLSSNAAEILEGLGETVFTQDMIADDGGHYSPAWRTMYWSHGKEILAAAEIAARTPNLVPVFITSFGCGPDSFTIRLARDILGEKPMLVLEVDEHSSAVGMETRIEAFLDALPRAPAARATAPRGAFCPPRGIRRVWLPHFSDHALAFAAAIRALGFEPRLTALPDDVSAKLGAAHATHGECHPYALMLGDYLKVAAGDEHREGDCYFMPESGACRVGLFGTQMRLAAEEAGARLPVFTRIDDLAPSIAKNSRRMNVTAVTTYWEMMRGMDFFLQQYYETRAYERVPGAADIAREAGRRILWERILEGRAREGIAEASSLLAAVPTDRSQRRLRIGITGDYYTRICDYANGEVFREIEKLGGVVMLAPTMSEFVKYDAHHKPTGMLRHRRPADAIAALAIRGVVDRRERRVRALFDGRLDYDVPLEYGRAVELIAPYMDEKLPAGLAGSVAAILEQIRAGADGILNLITFHCSYGLVIGAALAKIDRDVPAIPKLTLIFEGLKPTHNRTRLEAFMERVRERAGERA